MFSKFFVNKKILIYGLGLSGNSCLKYLHKNNNVKVFDDNNSLKNKQNKKFFLVKKKILSENLIKFDVLLFPTLHAHSCGAM